MSVGSFVFVEHSRIIENQFMILKFCTSVAQCICSIVEVIAVYSVVFLLYDRCGSMRQYSVWKFLKKNSFGIYLFHQQIVYLTIIPLNGRVHPMIQVGISFLIAIAGAAVIAVMLKNVEILLHRILHISLQIKSQAEISDL